MKYICEDCKLECEIKWDWDFDPPYGTRRPGFCPTSLCCKDAVRVVPDDWTSGCGVPLNEYRFANQIDDYYIEGENY